MTATAAARPRTTARVTGRRRIRWGRVGTHTFLIGIVVVWLFPLVWTIYTSLRPYDDTSRYGYVSFPGLDLSNGIRITFPGEYNLGNYVEAWDRGEIPKYFINTVIILVPSVILVLFLASMIAFAVSRFSWRFNLTLLMLFTAGNLLPPQVIITPLFELYNAIPMPFGDDRTRLFYDQHLGIIAIHVAFQLGFCAFVLSNYMKTLPHELTEAALVDGASVWQIYRKVTLPLCRPPLAALATLQVTWIYNDFFWALILMFTGNKLPITSALNNLRGQFFTDNNLLAAGAIMVALPTLIVYFLLQRHFISGLTLGSTKG